MKISLQSASLVAAQIVKEPVNGTNTTWSPIVEGLVVSVERATKTIGIAEKVSRICNQIGKYLLQKHLIFTRRLAQNDKPKQLLNP